MNTWEERWGRVARFRITHGDVAVTWGKEQGFKGYLVDEGAPTGVGYKSSAILQNLRKVNLSPISSALSEALDKAPKRSLKRKQVLAVLRLLEDGDSAPEAANS